MKGLTSDGGVGSVLFRLGWLWLDVAVYLVIFLGLGGFLSAMVKGLMKV
jgi:hypothetical protein